MLAFLYELITGFPCESAEQAEEFLEFPMFLFLGFSTVVVIFGIIFIFALICNYFDHM